MKRSFLRAALFAVACLVACAPSEGLQDMSRIFDDFGAHPQMAKITAVPDSGYVGDTIRIVGSGFFGVTSVSFNGTPAVTYSVAADAITVVVPTGATTGAITVTGAYGSASTQSFTVLSLVTLDHIVVTPSTFGASVGGSTQQLLVTAVYSDLSEVDVTADVGTAYVSSSPSKATVSAGGLISPVAVGSTTVTVTFGGQGDTCEVAVAGTLMDFTTGSLPTGVTAGLASAYDIWQQDGISTCTKIAGPLSGAAFFEKIAGPRGVARKGLWSLRAYENRTAMNPDNAGYDATAVTQTGPSGGFSWGNLNSPLRTAHVINAPDGTAAPGADSSARCGDASAAASRGCYNSPQIKSGGGRSSSSVWGTNDSTGPNGAPTQRAAMESVLNPISPVYWDTTPTDTWIRRVTMGSSQPFHLLLCAADPLNPTTDPAAGSPQIAGIGDRGWWGAQAAQRGGSENVDAMVPLSLGTVGSQRPTLASSSVYASCYSSGKYGVELEFTLPSRWGNVENYRGSPGDMFRIWHDVTSTGVLIDIWFEYDGVFNIYATVDNGVTVDAVRLSSSISSVSTGGMMGGCLGSNMYVRLKHDAVTSGVMSIDAAVNGSFFRAQSVDTAAATVAIGNPGTAYFGNAGSDTNEISDIILNYVRGCPGLTREITPEGLFIGDSTGSMYIGGAVVQPVSTAKPRISDFIYTSTEGSVLDPAARDGIRHIGKSGATIADQLSAYNALSSAEKAGFRWVCIMVGINDVTSGSYTAAQILTAYAALVAAIKAGSPSAVIYSFAMTPADDFLDTLIGGDAGIKTRYSDVQTGFQAVVAGVDHYSSLTWSLLSDGIGSGWLTNMLALWSNGDALHPNFDARLMLAVQAIRYMLVLHGSLPA